GMNNFTIDQLTPDIYFSIEKLEPGQYTDPTPYSSADGSRGFRILYLKSRTKPHKASLEEDYSRIQNAALNLKKMERVQDWFMKTKTKTYIKIEDEYQVCEDLKRWL